MRPCRLVATLVVLSACGGGGGPTAPGGGSPELTRIVESATVVFHFADGDSVEVERQEAYDEWIAAELGVALPGKLRYFKYLSRPHMLSLTGREANGFAEPPDLEVHSLFGFHAHETAHVYSFQAGRPTDFFNEGLAVALAVDPLAGHFEPTYDGSTNVHDWAGGRIGSLRRLSSIVTTADFRSVPEGEGYPLAGSFVAYLLDRQGGRAMMDFFSRGSRQDSLARVQSSFRATYGFDLEEAERRWRAFLAGRA